MMTDTVTDELARSAIRALLAGIKPVVDPADCGRWVNHVETLLLAFDRGGQSTVFWEYNLMATDLDLAGLMAGAQMQAKVTQAAPTQRAIPSQIFQDETADDEGNAQCLHSIFGREFLYCDAYGYLQWVSNCWRVDGADAALERAAVYTLKQRRSMAAKVTREDLVRCAVPNAHRVKDCLYLFRSLITTNVTEFDQSPEELNCANGVLNLATGHLDPHHAGQRFTYCLPVDYDPKADQAMWKAFLADVVGGGPEVLEYLQVAVGYSLTGYTREECLFYIYGPTRSGKGTFSETLSTLLPKPLAVQVDFTTFTADRGADTQNFDLAPLKPARLILASESNKYQALNPGKVKALTGGDDVYCAFKHRDHFSYRPQYKLWLISNHPVNADVDDDALWYRVKVIEFPNSLAGHEDTSLKLRMKQPESLKGVLAWAVEGAMKWFSLGPRGLHPHTPQVILDSTKQHRADLDYTQSWIDECCLINPSRWEASDNLYQSYKLWCVGNGVEMRKLRSFTLSLRGKGFQVSVQQKVNNKNLRGIIGLQLVP